MIPVVILDLQLEHESGLDVLKQILALRTATQVIMLTGYGTIETAVEAIKLGAFDFIQKPAQIDKLAQLVQNAIAINALPAAANDAIQTSADASNPIITQNAGMLDVCERARQVAPSDLPVLICGESGTGKELLADFIHAHSARLKNTLHYAATVCRHNRIGVEHLPPNFFHKRDARVEGGVREDVEKALILNTLQEVYYNKSKAAERLNMSRSTLYAKMQKYGIKTKP